MLGDRHDRRWDVRCFLGRFVGDGLFLRERLKRRGQKARQQQHFQSAHTSVPHGAAAGRAPRIDRSQLEKRRARCCHRTRPFTLLDQQQVQPAAQHAAPIAQHPSTAETSSPGTAAWAVVAASPNTATAALIIVFILISLVVQIEFRSGQEVVVEDRADGLRAEPISSGRLRGLLLARFRMRLV
jgi:hypothetical protein